MISYWLLAPVYSGMSVMPDWGLGLLSGLGGMAGMYVGAALQRFVPAAAIKLLLALAALFPAAMYLFVR